MIYLGKYKLLNNFVDACDYEYILTKVFSVKKNNRPLLITPIATDSIVQACLHIDFKKILDEYNYLLPDSQWVKRSIGFLYGKWLKERVYGPELMLKICGLSIKHNLKVFCYGSTNNILSKLKKNLKKKFPNIRIAGMIPARYDQLDLDSHLLTTEVQKTKADIIFVSLGGIKQIQFSFDLSVLFNRNYKPLLIMPVGAAFDYISDNKPQAPTWMQNWGLEWLFRLTREPLRLWKRYLIFAPIFIVAIFWQKLTYRKNVK